MAEATSPKSDIDLLFIVKDKNLSKNKSNNSKKINSRNSLFLWDLVFSWSYQLELLIKY